MARGFESKDVEFQQAEAERRANTAPAPSAAERRAAEARHTIELALTLAKSQRASARNPNHRRMLDDAIETLERKLRQA
jgi:hypothetical protein